MKKRYAVLIYLGAFIVILILLNKLNADPKLGVVICKGPNSTAYHNSFHCEGLGVCKQYAVAVSEREAIEVYRRNPCNFCYSNADQLEKNLIKSDVFPPKINGINEYDKMPTNIDDIPFYGTDN
jgi:hypothetical protein